MPTVTIEYKGLTVKTRAPVGSSGGIPSAANFGMQLIKVDHVDCCLDCACC
jgi:hypothetical protein